MQNKRDQLQAHLFVMSRLTSAVVRAEPDAVHTPMRRTTIATFVGVMLAVLLTAVFAIIGLISPSAGTTWQQPGTIIVESDTGSRFLFVNGALRPVLNEASAKLLTGGKGKIVQVSSADLANTPHGTPIGLPGAPDSLPDVKNLNGNPWLVCAPTVTDTTGTAHQEVTALIGGPGTAAGTATDDAIVVQTPDGTTYLIWHGKHFRASEARLTALGYGGATPFPVPAQWINALNTGEDIQAMSVPGLGSAGPAVDGNQGTVGQVFVTQVGAAQSYFVLESDGLLPISTTQAALLLGDPASSAAYPNGQVAAIKLSAAGAAGAARSSASAPTGQFPGTPPKLIQPPGDNSLAPCARLTFGSPSGPNVQLAVVDTAATGASASDPISGTGQAANKVVVSPGGGLLARELPAPGVTTGTLYLVTDLSVKYPLGSSEIAGDLGYGGAQPVPVPSTMLSLLPTGPALTPQAAAVAQPAIPPAPGN